MIKQIAIVVGSAVAIGAAAYVTRKWWMPIISKSKTNPQSTSKIKKENIDKLSYEYIVKSVKAVLSDTDDMIKDNDKATLWVMPNKIAKDYYDFAKNKGQSFFIKDELTDDEKNKMVVVLITTEDSIDGVIWGKVFIPNVLTEDFHDFIPSDKLYQKGIKFV